MHFFRNVILLHSRHDDLKYFKHYPMISFKFFKSFEKTLYSVSNYFIEYLININNSFMNNWRAKLSIEIPYSLFKFYKLFFFFNYKL